MSLGAAAVRDLDLVFWGATGFTGRLSVAAMAGHAASFYSCHLPNVGSPRGGGRVRYALAGRNEEKLRRVHAECGCGPDVDIFVAGAEDEAALAAFVSRTKVVVALAGPFKFHSDIVVGLCARLGTHYVDITGEVAWVRSVIDRYDEVARSTGALICNCCGFDSVPFDLGAQFAINRLRARGTASSIRRVSAYSVMGGPSGPGMLISGGTLTSGASMQQVQLTKGVDKDDPFLLGGLPKGGPREEDTDASTHEVRKLGEGLYCGPSMMHSVNSRLVRRSARLLRWGPAFNFAEVMPVPSERAAAKLVKRARAPAPPEVVEQLMAAGRLPKPGEGPLPEVRRVTRFATVLDAPRTTGAAWWQLCGAARR
ncbi:unnamed protein product, partial [Prorocentrum cordatum]